MAYKNFKMGVTTFSDRKHSFMLLKRSDSQVGCQMRPGVTDHVDLLSGVIYILATVYKVHKNNFSFGESQLPLKASQIKKRV